MRLKFELPRHEVNKLEANLNESRIFATKEGMVQLENAVDRIMDMSAFQVPMRTATLANATFKDVQQHDRVTYSITFGYGGPGDQVNPETGQLASEYMVAVHEDLTVHYVQGKAKFFEDPLNEVMNALPTTLIDKMKNVFERVQR